MSANLSASNTAGASTEAQGSNHETTDHLRSLIAQLSSFFKHNRFEISRIEGGASSRRYYCIHFNGPHYFPNDTVALMQIPIGEKSAMFNDYVYIDYYLKRCGIPTPMVYEIQRNYGWIFLEYKSCPTVEQLLHHQPKKIEQYIPAIVEHIVNIQQKCRRESNCPAFHRAFDYEKYMYEFNFHFQQHLLGYFNIDGDDHPELQDFAEEISRYIDIDVAVFVHRDMQSSNIFADNGPDAPRFSLIDFQDARYGNPVYDLVACLWDSYISISPALREKMLDYYYRKSQWIGLDWDEQTYRKMIDYTVIQRKLHDAGAFAYNYRRTGSHKYVGYISEAIEMALQKISVHPEFKRQLPFFESLLTIARQQSTSL